MKRSNSFGDDNPSRLQMVPWFNKKEWEEVYHQAYSEESKLQEKAYTQMCIWKARYPNLALGVECTMSILHVRLCDGQTSAAPYSDRNLQLLYSTAVMRFLNHLTTMSGCKDSMYKMAEQHKIPDWMINLRHETAHGHSVPDLYLLRQAAAIILQWLKEHYWQVEEQLMADVLVDREPDRQGVTGLLNLWVALKLHYWAGLRTVDRLPTEHLRNQALELAEEEGIGIKHAKETGSNKMTKSRKTEAHSFDATEVILDDNAYTHKIKTAFEPLLRRLFDPLKAKSHKKIQHQELLVECLAKHQDFCPSIDIDSLSEEQVEEVISLQGELWKEVVEGLQAHGLLHALLRTLMPSAAQLTSAALWLRLLSQLLAGRPPPCPPPSRPVSELMADTLPYQLQPEVLFRRASQNHAKHQRLISLKTPSAKELDVLEELARRVLDNPTKVTCRSLDSLLCFWECPLSEDTKQKLCGLAYALSGQAVLGKRPDRVFTLASLLDHGLVIDPPQTSQSPTLGKNHSLLWTPYTGDADWSKCALGALPW